MSLAAAEHADASPFGIERGERHGEEVGSSRLYRFAFDRLRQTALAPGELRFATCFTKSQWPVISADRGKKSLPRAHARSMIGQAVTASGIERRPAMSRLLWNQCARTTCSAMRSDAASRCAGSMRYLASRYRPRSSRFRCRTGRGGCS